MAGQPRAQRVARGVDGKATPSAGLRSPRGARAGVRPSRTHRPKLQACKRTHGRWAHAFAAAHRRAGCAPGVPLDRVAAVLVSPATARREAEATRPGDPGEMAERGGRVQHLADTSPTRRRHLADNIEVLEASRPVWLRGFVPGETTRLPSDCACAPRLRARGTRAERGGV